MEITGQLLDEARQWRSGGRVWAWSPLSSTRAAVLCQPLNGRADIDVRVCAMAPLTYRRSVLQVAAKQAAAAATQTIAASQNAAVSNKNPAAQQQLVQSCKVRLQPPEHQICWRPP